MDRFVLTDAQWAKMEPHCLGKPSDPGRSGNDNRLFVEGRVRCPPVIQSSKPHQRRARNKPVPRFQRKHGGVLTFGLIFKQRRFNNVYYTPEQTEREARPAQPEGGPAEPET